MSEEAPLFSHGHTMTPIERVEMLMKFRHELSTSVLCAATNATVEHAHAFGGLSVYEEILLLATPAKFSQQDLEQKTREFIHLETALLDKLIHEEASHSILTDARHFEFIAEGALEFDPQYVAMRNELLQMRIKQYRIDAVYKILKNPSLPVIPTRGPDVPAPAEPDESSNRSSWMTAPEASAGSSTLCENASPRPGPSAAPSVGASPLKEDPITSALASMRSDGKRSAMSETEAAHDHQPKRSRFL